MADSSLVGVFIGGLIGIAGGVIGPLVLEWRKQVYEGRKRQEDKLEALSSALYAHEHWISQVRAAVLAGERDLHALVGKLPPPPMAILHTMSSLYFPEFQDHIKHLSKISAEWTISIVRSANPNDIPSTDYYVRTIVDYNEAVKHTEELIRDYSAREFLVDSNKSLLDTFKDFFRHILKPNI